MFRVIVLFKLFIILVCCIVFKSVADQSPVIFTFKEYQYKDTPKNVRLYLSCCDKLCRLNNYAKKLLYRFWKNYHIKIMELVLFSGNDIS